MLRLFSVIFPCDPCLSRPARALIDPRVWNQPVSSLLTLKELNVSDRFSVHFPSLTDNIFLNILSVCYSFFYFILQNHLATAQKTDQNHKRFSFLPVSKPLKFDQTSNLSAERPLLTFCVHLHRLCLCMKTVKPPTKTTLKHLTGGAGGRGWHTHIFTDTLVTGV